jgi:hypothetical protein
MVCPLLCSRIKESGNVSCLGIHACEIWAFVAIASTASPAKVCNFVNTAVLPGHHVFDMEGPLISLCWKTTILTAVPSALSNDFSR